MRFEADRTATLMLGTRDHMRGYAAPYFAGLVATRLGIPRHRIRLYYTGSLPAVKISVRAESGGPGRDGVGTTNALIGELVERLCDAVIANGRRHLAASAAVPEGAIRFDASSGEFRIGRPALTIRLLDLAARSRRLAVSIAGQEAEFGGSAHDRSFGQIVDRVGDPDTTNPQERVV